MKFGGVQMRTTSATKMLTATIVLPLVKTSIFVLTLKTLAWACVYVLLHAFPPNLHLVDHIQMDATNFALKPVVCVTKDILVTTIHASATYLVSLLKLALAGLFT